METAVIEDDCEEREEGEIVEDDLEDVSDCSMFPGSPLYSGKSVSPPELLSAVCLSSGSSSEYSAGGRRYVRAVSFSHHEERHQHKRRRKSEDRPSKRKHCRHARHHRKLTEETDTASDNELVDPKYAKKLRAALRRESSQQDLLHNSLKTRLKAFIEPASQSDEELSLNTLRDLALISTFKNEKNPAKPQVNVQSDPQSMNELRKEPNQKDENSTESGKLPQVNESKKDSEEDDLNFKLLNDVENTESDDQIFENADDSELRELRIAALKSFVMENHNRRRRKAAGENHDKVNDGGNKSKISDIDKENDNSMINNDLDGKSGKNNLGNSEKNDENPGEVIKPVDDSPVKKDDINADDGNCTDCTDSLEDDVDILRAMLLASMSTQLAGKTAETNSPLKTVGASRRRSELCKVEKSKANQNSLSVTITKPLFRTIKNDLYTITNTNGNHFKNNKPSEQPHLPTNVVVKPLIINVNADSDSDTENSPSLNETNKVLKATVTEFLKKQRAEVEASVKKKTSKSPDSSLNNKSDDLLMEKSAVKLLPKSQQIEYRKLKQQLMQVHRKLRARKSSQRLSESKRETTANVKKVPKLKIDGAMNNYGTASGRIIKSAQEKKSLEPAYVQKALVALQVRKNGRLQMKGKYRSLGPLLHRINQASNERRQHEIEIKKLLQQIQRARVKLAASHDNFTALVQQLLKEKNYIDQCMLKGTKFSQATPFTSTPNKLVEKIQTCDISLVKESASTTENNNSKVNQPEDQKIENETNEHEESTNAKQDIEQNLQKAEVLLDPNDITKVFVEQPVVESTTFPKYTSPLDNRDGINDPLTTVCPYDLLGVCKDKECRYRHCS